MHIENHLHEVKIGKWIDRFKYYNSYIIIALGLFGFIRHDNNSKACLSGLNYVHSSKQTLYFLSVKLCELHVNLKREELPPFSGPFYGDLESHCPCVYFMNFFQKHFLIQLLLILHDMGKTNLKISLTLSSMFCT